jgi:hypothetical protein
MALCGVWSEPPHAMAGRTDIHDSGCIVMSTRRIGQNMILIIESMCNIKLLYDAASQSGETRLVDMMTPRARTLLTTRLRPESLRRKAKNKNGYTGQRYSTYHVARLDPNSQLTAQRYADASTWARGYA